jgi:hypothetical protein
MVGERGFEPPTPWSRKRGVAAFCANAVAREALVVPTKILSRFRRVKVTSFFSPIKTP